MAKKKKKEPEWPLVFDTYYKPDHDPGSYCYGTIRRADDPWTINGRVGVTRYRVTIERIDEPKEEIKRLRKLWKENKNFHLWGPLKAEAARLGIELKH